MRYKAPYGSSDPDASYVDRSTPDAQSGSKVPRQAVEHPQREIIAVIADAGLTPSEGDLTQLLQAINIKIERLRVNLPIFPQVENSTGKLTVTAISPGLIRIPAGQEFTIRGGKLVTTEVTDLVTVPNRTYHLRWNAAWTASNGFELKSLADVTYNASGLAADEILPAFDSSYDEPLFARVVTDGSNVATITPLVNKADLASELKISLGLPSALAWTTLASSGATLDWSRKPKFGQPLIQGARSFDADMDGSVHGVGAGIWRAFGMRIPSPGVTRYGAPNVEYAYEDDAGNAGFLDFVWTFFA